MTLKFDLNPKTWVKNAFKIKNKVCQKGALEHLCRNFSSKLYAKSQNTALVMLVFNAVGILSSHLSQIGGLKRSKRENKDFLIQQEKEELLLDVGFQIIPPFLINRHLGKLIDSGKIMTRSFENKVLNNLTEIVGCTPEDVCKTEHIRPLKEEAIELGVKALEFLGGPKRKLPKDWKVKINKAAVKLDAKLPPKQLRIKAKPFLQELTARADTMVNKGLVNKDYLTDIKHGSFCDEFWKQRTGFLILAGLLYSVIAGNIVTPILKNKLANRRYDKKLKKLNITEEDLKRIKRYDFKRPNAKNFAPRVFDDYTEFDSSLNMKNSTYDYFSNTLQSAQNQRVGMVFKPFVKYDVTSSKIRI